MSRGPGHVERSIRALFDEHPDEAWSLRELAEACYPAVIPQERHLGATRRAAAKVLARDVDWVSSTGVGSTLWFYNLASAQSVAMWWLIGHSMPVGRIMSRGSNSGHMTRQEALQRLRPGGRSHDLLRLHRGEVERHIARRPHLVGFTPEERYEIEQDVESRRRHHTDEGKILFDMGWSTTEITSALNLAQVAANKAWARRLQQLTGVKFPVRVTKYD